MGLLLALCPVVTPGGRAVTLGKVVLATPSFAQDFLRGYSWQCLGAICGAEDLASHMQEGLTCVIALCPHHLKRHINDGKCSYVKKCMMTQDERK